MPKSRRVVFGWQQEDESRALANFWQDPRSPRGWEMGQTAPLTENFGACIQAGKQQRVQP